MSETWLIVGLGNPGSEYVGTRHNAGFIAADILANRIRANYWKNECGSLVANNEYEGKKLVVAKPQSFMNLSGAPVALLMKKFDVAADHLIIMHDEVDLSVDSVRVKFGGGHAGHNGLRSIIERIGTRDFYRVRIGVGRPPGQMPMADYVLQRPRGEAAEALDVATQRAVDAALCLIEEALSRCQQEFR